MCTILYTKKLDSAIEDEEDEQTQLYTAVKTAVNLVRRRKEQEICWKETYKYSNNLMELGIRHNSEDLSQ